jgi:nitrate/nitrite transport system ATP-binding protein
MATSRPEPRVVDRAAAKASPVLALRGVSKSLGKGAERVDVLGCVDFELGEGEIVAIVGFSGTGKTTLLSIMAGILEPDVGRVELDGAPAGEPGPERGVVFQSYALLPWMTALENVELAAGAVVGAKSAASHKRRNGAGRRETALEWLRLVGLGHAWDRRPHELSGGMRQRVAVARALAHEPRILLLDEPLGALDALTRGSLQLELARIFERERRSAVLVTNDVDEALLLADRVIALVPGLPAELGPSFHVPFERPRDRHALHHDPAFKKLRNELVNHLLALAERRVGPTTAGERTPLPPLRPMDLRLGVPRADVGAPDVGGRA